MTAVKGGKMYIGCADLCQQAESVIGGGRVTHRVIHGGIDGGRVTGGGGEVRCSTHTHEFSMR